MRFLRHLAALAVLLLVAMPSFGAGLASFPPGTVSIVTAGGSHRIVVEVASSEAQREQGLMFRTSLGKDAGMLFLYPSPQPIAMWMKNTLIPLDMLFIQADGTISAVRERAVPQSLETIGSGGLAKGVLELNGGTVARLGIKLGDKIVGEGLGP